MSAVGSPGTPLPRDPYPAVRSAAPRARELRVDDLQDIPRNREVAVAVGGQDGAGPLCKRETVGGRKRRTPTPGEARRVSMRRHRSVGLRTLPTASPAYLNAQVAR